MAVEPAFEYEDMPIVIGNMWADLARLIHGQIADIYIGQGPVQAMQYAKYAEACYWKAQGEDPSFSAKDILSSSDEVAAPP